MNRVLVIDQDRATRETLGLACLGRNVAVAFADNVCDAVRTLLTLPVSLIVVGAASLRMTIREHVLLFDRVAPGIPVVVSVPAETPLELRVRFEIAGFRVLTQPVAIEDLLDKPMGLRG